MARSAMRHVEERRPRVLVVDDLGYARDALAELLRSASYEVASAGSGAEALDELERHGADLVLSDIYMPRMTGWELAHAVRERGVTNARGLPICIGLYSALLSGFSRQQLSAAVTRSIPARSTSATMAPPKPAPVRRAPSAPPARASATSRSRVGVLTP